MSAKPSPAGGKPRRSNLDEIRRTRRDVERTWDIVKFGARGLVRSEIPRMAAALSFRTIFGLVPIIVMGVALLGSFRSPEEVTSAVRSLLDYAGLSVIEVEDVGSTSPTSGPGAVELFQVAPAPGSSDARIDDWIVSLVSRVQDISFRAVGIAGVLFLIYAAMSLFLEMERSFNQICRAPSGRSWGGRIILYWAMLSLGLLSLLSSFWVGGEFTGWVGTIGGSFWFGIAGFVVTVAISTLLLITLYTRLPNTHVTLRSAAAGAVVGAILWETGKWGFTRYLTYSTSYVSFYGSVALLLLFMIWVQVTWVFVLFGLQVAYAFQHFEQFRRQGSFGEAASFEGPVILDPVVLVRVAAHAARRFARGETASARTASKACRLDESVAGVMLDRLAGSGVLRVVEGTGQDEPERFTLARPAGAIAVRELVALGVGSESEEAPRTPLARLVAARVDAAGEMTLAEISEKPASSDEAEVIG